MQGIIEPVYEHKVMAQTTETQADMDALVASGFVERTTLQGDTKDSQPAVKITPAGIAEWQNLRAIAIAAIPQDAETERALTLRQKAIDGTLTSAEKVEAIDLVLKRWLR